jgi:hypothetical protein
MRCGSTEAGLHGPRIKVQDRADFGVAKFIKVVEHEDLAVDLPQLAHGLAEQATALIARQAVAWRGPRVDEAGCRFDPGLVGIKPGVTLPQDAPTLGPVRADNEPDSLEEPLPEPVRKRHPFPFLEELVERLEGIHQRLLHKVLGIDAGRKTRIKLESRQSVQALPMNVHECPPGIAIPAPSTLEQVKGCRIVKRRHRLAPTLYLTIRARK